jgi:hypothetical protein
MNLPMSIFPLVASSLTCLFLVTGCASKYDIMLMNGHRITGVSKPELDKTTGKYNFKDASGQTMSISAMRVREIAPHSGSSKQNQGFNSGR